MSSIVNFVNSLSNTRQILPSIPGDVFERAGPGYYDKSYPDEIEHNGYVDEDDNIDINGRGNYTREEQDDNFNGIPDDIERFISREEQDDNFNGIPDDIERGTGTFGSILGQALGPTYPQQTLVELKDLPSIEAGPVWYQTNINDCWANAFSAMFHSEMIKRDPQAVHPSVTWMVVNATGRLNKAAIKCNNLALPTRFSSKVSGYGFLPYGILESAYGSTFKKSADDKVIYDNDMNLARCKLMTSSDKTDRITNVNSVYEQIARNFPIPQFVGDFDPSDFCLFEEGFTKQSFGGMSASQNNVVKTNLIYDCLSKGFTVYIEMYISLGYFARFRHPKTDDYAPYDAPIKYSDYVDYGDNILHAMTITGFKTVKGVPCFLVKNSFGRRWAVNGYFWLSADSCLGIRKAYSFANMKFIDNPLPFRTVKNVEELKSLPPLTGEIKLVTSNAPYGVTQAPPPSTVSIQPGQPQPLPQPGLPITGPGVNTTPDTEPVGCKQSNAVGPFKQQTECASCVDLYVKTRCKGKTPDAIKRCEDFARKSAGYCRCLCNPPTGQTVTQRFFDFFKKSK